MLDDKTKQKLTDLVHNEISGICRLYGVNLYELNSKQKEMLVAIFQSGVSFIGSFGHEALQDDLSHEKIKDD